MDKQGKVGEKYGVQATPTIMFLDENGKLLGEFTGFHQPKEFIEESMRVLKKRKGK
jgi:thioredoxin-related protein